MNWHLSTDPERPQNDEFCVIVVKRKKQVLRRVKCYVLGSRFVL